MDNESCGAAENGASVPIFALHPKGSFYVAMSVQLSLINSLFHPIDAPSSNTPSPVLHPVMINVNFCHPLRMLSSAKPTTAAVVPPQRPQAAPVPPLSPLHHSQPPPHHPQPVLPHPQAMPQPQRYEMPLLPFGSNMGVNGPTDRRSHRMSLISPIETMDAAVRVKRHPFELDSLDQHEMINNHMARLRAYSMRQAEARASRFASSSNSNLFRIPRDHDVYDNHVLCDVRSRPAAATGAALTSHTSESTPIRSLVSNGSSSTSMCGSSTRSGEFASASSSSSSSSTCSSSSQSNSSRWSHLMAANKRHTQTNS